MRKLFQIDPELVACGRPVVVVGTGRMALLAHTCLLQEGVAVEAFCDPSGRDVASSVMGRPVVGVGELRDRWADAALVWAGDDLARAEAEADALGMADAWVDLRAYGIVNDCTWTFM